MVSNVCLNDIDPIVIAVACSTMTSEAFADDCRSRTVTLDDLQTSGCPYPGLYVNLDHCVSVSRHVRQPRPLCVRIQACVSI